MQKFTQNHNHKKKNIVNIDWLNKEKKKIQLYENEYEKSQKNYKLHRSNWILVNDV